jgi:hypothetical protein
MKKFYVLEELFFGSISEEEMCLVSKILEGLNCLTEDGNKLILSCIPTEESIEESIDSLILNSQTIEEMKNKLFVIKSLQLLDLQEENALANLILNTLGFSEKIEATISIEDAIESEEKIAADIENEEQEEGEQEQEEQTED